MSLPFSLLTNFYGGDLEGNSKIVTQIRKITKTVMVFVMFFLYNTVIEVEVSSP